MWPFKKTEPQTPWPLNNEPYAKFDEIKPGDRVESDWMRGEKHWFVVSRVTERGLSVWDMNTGSYCSEVSAIFVSDHRPVSWFRGSDHPMMHEAFRWAWPERFQSAKGEAET